MNIIINVTKFHKDRLKDHVTIIHENVLKFVRQARCYEVKLGLVSSIAAEPAAELQSVRAACSVLPV